MLMSHIYERIPMWHAENKPHYIKGSTGTGKTSLFLGAPARVKQATGKDLGCVVINAFTYTPMHMLGFGVVKHEQLHHSMIFSDPFFWTTIDGRRLEDFKDGGYILVDEADKGDLDLMKILFEMGNSGKVGMHELPPNWVVVFIANPNDARYGSKKMLDYCLNRVTLLSSQSDPDFWVSWGTKAGLLPHTLAFASHEQYRATVFSDELPAETKPWCTQRSLHRLDHKLQTEMRMLNLSAPPDHEDVLEEAEGTIGTGPAQDYFRLLKASLGVPSIATVLADPMKAPLPDPDCRHLFCFNAAFAATIGNIQKLINYVDRLPKEYATTFMRATIDRAPKLITAPAVGKWAQGNAQLLMLLSRYASAPTS